MVKVTKENSLNAILVIALLVVPFVALALDEPDQREFISIWRSYYGTLYRYVWSKPPSDGTFVDDWARYTAAFEAVARSHDYKKLMRPKKSTNSLKDFALHPPTEKEELAAVLKQVVTSVENCVKMAKDTQEAVKRLPHAHIAHQRDIRKLQDEVSRLQRKAGKAPRALRKAQHKLDERTTRMHNALDSVIQNADTAINDFARERTVARRQLEAAWDHLVSAGTASSAPVAAGRQTEPTQLPSDQLADQYRQFVNKYLAEAKELTSVGRAALRDRTEASIERLFVGKQFMLHLEVIDIRQAGVDGYVLVANHRGGGPGAIVTTAEFQFSGELRSDLIGCRTRARIELTAQIKQVALTPGLDAASESNRPPVVHLIGDVLSVAAGCTP